MNDLVCLCFFFVAFFWYGLTFFNLTHLKSNETVGNSSRKLNFEFKGKFIDHIMADEAIFDPNG
jgi:hypothetical protein